MVSLSVLLGVGTAAVGSWLSTAQGDTAQLGAAALVLPNSSSSTGGDPRAALTGGVAGGPVDTETPVPPASPTTSTAPTTSSQPPATSSVAPPPSTKAAPPPAPKTAARSNVGGTTAAKVVDLVNTERSKAGCQPLAEESHLDKAAQDYSDEMSAGNFFAHTNPSTGITFDQRIKKAGYSKPGGENIAKGQTSATQVMESWMNSEGHRANILNCSFTKIGVGLTNQGGPYWVQDFGY